jgi:outer membrane protein OmpA-like peptidoglycan-associated protein/5-hydroxyisourate hydrolase-like protein (transthyretin family)
MKKNILNLLSLVAFMSLPTLIMAQSKAGDKLFDKYLYSEAIIKYEGIKNKDENTTRRLADAYRLTSDPFEAEIQYEALFNKGNVTADDVWNYAEVLKMNKKYPEALAKIAQYNSMKPGEKRAEYHLADNIYYDKLMADVDRFAVKELAFNSIYSDYAPTFYNAELVFVSSRPLYSFTEYNDGWTDNRFTNLFAGYDGKNKKNVPTINSIREVIIRGRLSKKFHEGPASFTTDGQTMIFTRNSYVKAKQLAASNERVLELWMSKLDVDGKWRNPVVLPFNKLEYNVGHPAIAPDGKTLYFISDMPGGFGGTDLYKCTMTADGYFGPAVNMGDKINTEGDEMYPFMHEKGILFFASNGHAGLGGLDLFCTKLSDDGKNGKIMNLGGSINSSMDDFGLIMDISMKRGFFSSNRLTGKGSDDIYAFDVLKPFTFNKAIVGIAKDKETGQPLAGVTVKLLDNKGNVISEVVTTESGAFSFDAEPNLDFSLTGNNTNYKEAKKNASTKTEDDVIAVDLVLEKMLSISVACLVTDNKSGTPLDSVLVTINDRNTGNKLFEGYTDKQGRWRHELEKTMMNTNISYVIKLDRKGYLAKTIEWSYRIYKEEEIRMHEFMDFNMGMLEVGIDLAKLLGLKDIYFDKGKWDIKPVAALELDKIVAAMKIYSTMHVALGAHTDCRGAVEANRTLSQKRAESCVNYIVSRGIDVNRIFPTGYGEDKLTNDCKCEGTVKSTCSEDDHAKNRRIEFIVEKYQN